MNQYLDIQIKNKGPVTLNMNTINSTLSKSSLIE
jgi:hypothetical protein